ncbi:MAG: phosphopentomutase [Clostridia bacterium]|nr:phosphopentomutase [Clostridia bacterium]
MPKYKRIFLVVADSMGIGAAPDASKYKNGDGTDEGSDTYGSLCKTKGFSAPFLEKLGIGNIDGVASFYPKCANPVGVYGKMREKSAGKDTVTGHWELAGVVSEKEMPTFYEGFPEELLRRLCERWGRGYLCNKPYSGTEVIRDYGIEHMKTGKLIVYTSADSVFQIAAHEETVPINELYRCCEIARAELKGEFAVGRVIARPFLGEYPDFYRTANRHDYSLEAPSDTLCDVLKNKGMDVIGVGKIGDIFAHRGLTEEIRTVSNTDGMNKTYELLRRDFHGLCFVNLVDFDMKYGHRRDPEGYAGAVIETDRFLCKFSEKMRDGDLLILTADHGCDPCHIGTDHTREYVPVLMYSRNIIPRNIGIRDGFCSLGATVADLFEARHSFNGSFADEI